MIEVLIQLTSVRKQGTIKICQTLPSTNQATTEPITIKMRFNIRFWVQLQVDKLYLIQCLINQFKCIAFSNYKKMFLAEFQMDSFSKLNETLKLFLKLKKSKGQMITIVQAELKLFALIYFQSCKLIEKNQFLLLQMSGRKQEVKKYLQDVVNPILKPIVQAIVKEQPQNILKFIHSYVEKELNSVNQTHADDLKQNTSQSQQEVLTQEQEQAISKQFAKKKQTAYKNPSRRGVSAEVFGQFNKKSQFVPRVIIKSEETNKFIKSLLQNSIMFQNLNEQNTKIVINAMQEKNAVVNQQIITEGEDGDVLYLIGSGQFECTKMINGTKTYLKTYKVGDLFGQLALMYNAKRAASIKCIKPGTIYALDRQTFTNIIQESAIKRRIQYMKIISQIQILSEVEEKEKQQLCDAFKQELFEPNKYVVKEGENGDRFYFIVEGNLVAEKHNPKTGKNQIVFKYKERQFFGEIALIKNTVRQASIKTVTKCRILSIGRDQFRRLLGPIQNILQRNALQYKKFISN